MSEIDWDTPKSAESYDQNCDHQFQKGQTLIEMMKIKNGDSVLDIGCGTGWQAVNVSGIIGPSGKLTCIDPSSYRIELARKKFGVDSLNSVRFLVGQAEDLSAIPDNSINHAYFCSSFHWIADKGTALNETYRVLQPGGGVGMTTLDRDSPDMMRTLVDPVLAKYNITRNYELHRGISRVNALELHNLLSEAGFTAISIEPRAIPRRYHSPEEFLKHLEERDSLRSSLKDIPDEIKDKIRQEIHEELAKIKTPAFVEFGIVTLFAIATKPNE
jgi:ubiquinone/menaquinone biosynthesis C-methylase UbiE